jgi:hypothetical protein
MLIQKRRSGQPQGAAKLRSELGFDSFILPGVGADLVTGAPVIMGTGESLLAGRNGAALYGTATNGTASAWTIPNSSNMLSTTEATVLIAGVQVGRSGAGGGSFGAATAGTADSSSCGSYLPYSDGKVYWDFGGSTEGATRLSVAGLTFDETDVFVFTVGPRGMEIWQNGRRVASNAGTPTRTTTSNAWGLRGHYLANSDPFKCYAFGYSRRQLSMAACADLSRHLWGTAFVQRRRGIIATLASAARRRIVMWG